MRKRLRKESLVSQPGKKQSILSIFGGLGWPLVIGGALSAGFFALMYKGPLNLPIFHRYFAGHPVSVVETVFFFIGVVALVLKALDVLDQQGSSDSISIGEPAVNQPLARCADMLDSLASLSSRLRNSYLGQRYISALESIERKGTADGLDDELKYLSDMDVGRQQESYSLVRIIIWATPMLGFLGTVMGITDALGDLGRQDMGNLKGAMAGLLKGLYVAFDTTAIALSFSMVLMFIQFIIDRAESQLLSLVDKRVSHDLIGRFETTGSTTDPNVASIQRMATSVLAATESLVKRQAELWQETLLAAHDRWDSLTQDSTQKIQQSLSRSIETAMQSHADTMAQVEEQSSLQVAKRWEAWQHTLSENAKVLHAQQVEMARQGELLSRTLEATSNVIQLETALNNNLEALSSSKDFEELVMSLSAAIHLLTARMGKNLDTPSVEFKPLSNKGRAA